MEIDRPSNVPLEHEIQEKITCLKAGIVTFKSVSNTVG